jgi:hypothetical protein
VNRVGNDSDPTSISTQPTADELEPDIEYLFISPRPSRRRKLQFRGRKNIPCHKKFSECRTLMILARGR